MVSRTRVLLAALAACSVTSAAPSRRSSQTGLDDDMIEKVKANLHQIATHRLVAPRSPLLVSESIPAGNSAPSARP